MNIMELNGGTILGMAGKECVCIASDLRLGSQMLTVVTNKPKIYRMSHRVYAGIAGLATDAQTIYEHMRFRTNIYELRENRHVSPNTFAAMLSNFLYEKRFGPFYSEPVVAGLMPDNSSYLCGMDLIGNESNPADFIATGTGDINLMGVAEATWEKDMDPDALFQTTSQAFLAAMERDAISGWGAVVYTVTPEKVAIKTIKCRMD